MSLSRVVFSSASDHWATPGDVYAALDKEFGFNYDPCPLGRAPLPLLDEKAEAIEDGLSSEWGTCTFVNPPYSEIELWCNKAVREWGKGKTVVMLIPSRTDTRYWHDYIMKASEIRFCRGRLRFGGAANSAPFPSAIIIFKGLEGE